MPLSLVAGGAWLTTMAVAGMFAAEAGTMLLDGGSTL